jgi:hypothetical protein
MQFLLDLFLVDSGARAKDIFRLDEQLILPVLDLIRMDIKVLGQFRQRVFALDSG